MKHLLYMLLLLAAAPAGQAQSIPSYTAEKLMSRVAHPDTTYIVNFWATWCGPCIRELPAFDSLHQAFTGQPVKVLLVSLDFKESYPAKLNTYVQRKKVLPEVVWFSETDANEFIPKIDSRKGNQWSGALPATMVVNARKSYQVFMEKPVSAAEVQQIVAEARR